jgi:hypothetical protein
VNAPDPLYPTLAELKILLVRDFNCWIDPPPKQIAYSPRPFTIFKRKTGDGDVLDCPLMMRDDERIDREIAIYICGRLRIYPGRLTFITNPPVP